MRDSGSSAGACGSHSRWRPRARCYGCGLTAARSAMMSSSAFPHAGRRASPNAVARLLVQHKVSCARSTALGSSSYQPGCPRGAALQPTALACVVACLLLAPPSMWWPCTCAATMNTNMVQRRVYATAQHEQVLKGVRAGGIHDTPRPVQRLCSCGAARRRAGVNTASFGCTAQLTPRLRSAL